jgi:hypothetical protein
VANLGTHSGVWRFLDIFRHIVVVLSALSVVGLVSTIHWVLAVIIAVPVYLALLNLIEHLTPPLNPLVPRPRTASELWKLVKDGDTEALRELAERARRE